MKKTKENNGITLIALVVTIVVLLILAAVSISTLTGDNGIITRADDAKASTEKAQEKEGLEIAVLSISDTLEIKKEDLEKGIKKQFGSSKDFTVTDNQDGSFLVNMNDTKRLYYIDDTEEVITEDNILKIGTEEELREFSDDVNNGNTYKGWYVYLENDIALDISEEWTPIGTYINSNTVVSDETNKPFKGIFDGRGHIIDGLKITSKEKGKGLFGIVNNGKIKNIEIGENCDINAGLSYGSITGYAYNGTIIQNCNNKANIKADSNNIGGIVGVSSENCIVKNCYNTANITTTGGDVGRNSWL